MLQIFHSLTVWLKRHVFHSFQSSGLNILIDADPRTHPHHDKIIIMASNVKLPSKVPKDPSLLLPNEMERNPQAQTRNGTTKNHSRLKSNLKRFRYTNTHKLIPHPQLQTHPTSLQTRRQNPSQILKPREHRLCSQPPRNLREVRNARTLIQRRHLCLRALRKDPRSDRCLLQDPEVQVRAFCLHAKRSPLGSR